MKTIRLAFSIWLAAACAFSTETTHNIRESALERILGERESPEAFAVAIDAAQKAGISEQAILEARFLYHVDLGNDAAIAALKPEFLKRRESFKIEDSAIFATNEDWLAVTEYVQALDALQREDTKAFKNHITEAFWLSPGQGAAFAPHIERHRLANAMKEVKIDFSTRLLTLHDGNASPLSKINANSKATLLHFWSPWSRECETTMPDFIATAIELTKHNIAVVSILPEQSQEARGEALEMVKPLGPRPPGAWLVDQPTHPLADILRIRTLPTMVLLDHDGTVLFNGHPTDPMLWSILAESSPGLTRPHNTEKN